jgi:mutator protein MutT
VVRVQVAIALILERGRWLVQRRSAGQHLAGMWEFPGGKLADAETPEAALLRELQEELAVGVQVVEALPVMHHDYPDRAVALHPYLCCIIAGEPRAVDGQEIRWLALEELLTLPIPAANRPLIQALRRRGD